MLLPVSSSFYMLFSSPPLILLPPEFKTDRTKEKRKKQKQSQELGERLVGEEGG